MKTQIKAAAASYTLRQVEAHDLMVLALVAKANEHPIEKSWYEVDKIDPDPALCLIDENTIVIGAFHNDKLIGVGAVTNCGTYGEVKRMFVNPAHRGTDVALLIMNALESHMKACGGKWLCLETQFLHLAAMKFFLKIGFQRIGQFGEYIPNNISVYMCRKIAD